MAVPTIADLARAKANLDAYDDVINEDENTSVTTPGGLPVDSVAKAIASIKAFNDRGNWATGTAYAVKDLVRDPDDSTGTVYVCVTNHTSGAGDFNTDYASGNGPWRIFQGGREVYESITGSVGLLANPGRFDGQAVTVLGYSDPGDGGGGDFYWDASSTDADDGGTVFIDDTNQGSPQSAGRWRRRLSGAINVRWFGAMGDGVTNDTSAIQSALDAGAGGTVYFPEGTYLISAGLRPSSNTTLLGDGYGSKITCSAAGWALVATTNFGLININDVNKVRVTNLRISGTKSADINNTPKLIYLEDVDGCTIDHNWLDTSAFEGIWSGGAQTDLTNLIITENHVNDVGYPAGAFVGLPAIQVTAVNIVCSGNNLFDVGGGIGICGDKCLVNSNLVKGITKHGISCGDSTTNGIYEIAGNVVEFNEQSSGSPRVGIYLGGAVTTERSINVTGNLVRVIGTAGIGTAVGYSVNTADDVRFTGNVAEIQVRGIGFEITGTTAPTNCHLSENTVRVVSESGASYGFYARPNGGGNTLNLVSSGNRVYGVTRAQGSYAFNYTTVGGGTLNCVSDGDYSTQGNVTVADLTYATSQLDGIPFHVNADLTKHTAFHRYASIGMLGLESPVDIVIASGVATITGSVASTAKRRTRIRLDTEAAGATDDLDTITGGQNGDIVILRANDSGRTVVVKDGTGNLRTAGDFSLDNTNDRIMLECDGTNWFELCRSDNAA